LISKQNKQRAYLQLESTPLNFNRVVISLIDGLLMVSK
jgi:hypothetical protein